MILSIEAIFHLQDSLRAAWIERLIASGAVKRIDFTCKCCLFTRSARKRCGIEVLIVVAERQILNLAWSYVLKRKEQDVVEEGKEDIPEAYRIIGPISV